MLTLLPYVAGLTLAAGPVASDFVQVAPSPATPRALLRSAGQTRAVVLIHGLTMTAFTSEAVAKPKRHTWQEPGSALVVRLAREADVFAFSYGQNASLADVIRTSTLGACLRTLRQMGYTSIILVGHSAGGLIARQFVEDNRDCGVEKVIQVCAPTGGSTLATFKPSSSAHKAFVESLTKDARRKALSDRAEVRFPAAVEMACVVGCGLGDNDGLVSVIAQWTPDLQNQGIPAYVLRESHRQAVRSAAAVELIARLVTTPQPRWDEARLQMERKHILGK